MRAYNDDNVTTIDDRRDEPHRRTAMLDYALHIGGMLLSMGILSLVALIINYIQRPSARGTIYESHFNWMIRTCWWTIAWVVILGIPVALTLGLLSFLWFIPAVWYLYRMIRGLLALNERRPMPA